IYALILSDHGMGWPGGWTDASSTGRGEDNVALANSTGDMIFLNELDRSLQQIRSTTGIDKFELVGLDACLMAHVEVFGMLSEHAKYAVASQEVEPAVGWAYTGFLGQLLSDPDVSGSDLGQYIVQTYINDDQRITDDQARAAWVGRGGFGVPTIAQLTKQLGDDITLTAVDLQKMPEVINALNTLAYQMQGDNQRGIAQARNYAQSFTSVFGRQVPPSYLDLGNLAQLIQRNSGNQQVSQAVDALLASLNDAIITERHGQKKPGATGMSVYFPNSDLYRNRVAGAQSYAEVASSFVENSLWDEFLAYHYTGRQFGPAEQLAAVPAAVDVAAPGKGDISISNLNISADSVDIGETVRITADISGDNIGYIKLFVGYLDERANSLNIIDSDYLESGETREVGGVYYPDWGEGDFELAFEWEPIVFAIDDGSQRALALFEPEAYGASVDDAVYSVDGVYTYDDGTTYRARMYFNNSDGTMRDVYGFAGDGTNGTPREITPSPGDTFTVLEQWLDQQPAGQPAVAATEPGSTVEMARQQLVWRDLDAPAGTFVLGFLVEDLDGNVYPAYGEIVVN
ncbi:MAG: clostripain-related cysteine peptidase, partial [Candidatus Promineifilaceae bacterium]